MSKFLAVVLISCLAFVSPGSPALADSWLMSGHDASATSATTDTQVNARTASRLREAWSVRGGIADLIATRKVVFALTLGPDRLEFVSTDTGRVIRLLGRRRLGLQHGERLQTLAYGHGKVVIGTDRAIEAVNASTGRRLWRESGRATSLVIRGYTVLAGDSCSGTCPGAASQAIDLRSGRVLWRQAGASSGRFTAIRGHLYQSWGETSAVTRVYGLNGHVTGTLSLSGNWIADGGRAYVESISKQGAIELARVRADGRLGWKLRLGAASHQMALAGHRLIVASNRYSPGISAVDDLTGKIIWAADVGPVGSLLVAGNVVLSLGTAPSRLSVLSAADGHILGSLSESQTYTRLIEANGTVYLAGSQGLAALRP
ncbi:MAG: PQQ-binding-like beta-propeller repeat protein [Chloroflexota bacterium]